MLLPMLCAYSDPALRRNAIEQIMGPEGGDGRHQIALVKLRRAGIHLPMFMSRHDFPSQPESTDELAASTADAG